MQKSAARGSQGIFVASAVGEGGTEVPVASGRTIVIVEVASGNAAAFCEGTQEARRKVKTKRGKKDFMLDLILEPVSLLTDVKRQAA